MAAPSKIYGSFAWSFLEQGSSKLIAMLVQIVLARLLSPDAFGVLAIILVVVNIADSIAQSGLGMALIQKSDATDDSYSTGWWLSLGIAVLLYALIFAIAPFVAAFYEMPELAAYLRVLGLVVIANAANSIQRSWLQRSMDFRGIFKVSLSAIVFSGAVGIGCALMGFGVWALVSQTLAQGVLTLAAMLIVVPWKPHLVFIRQEARELFAYGWKICVTGILNVLYTGISELVIGRACSAADLGFYSQGRKYPHAAIGVMTNAVANVLFPAFSSLKDEPLRLKSSMRRGLKVGTFIVAPVSMLFAVTAEPIVAILLTDKWLPCVPVFQLLCVSNSILMLQLVNLRAYMALGDSALYLKLQIIKVFAGGAIIWVTAAITKDIYATAIAVFVVSVLAILLVDMAPAKRLHGYSRAEQLRDIGPTIVLSAAASAVGLLPILAGFGYPIQLVIQAALFALVYVAGARVFRFEELGSCLALAGQFRRREG